MNPGELSEMIQLQVSVPVDDGAGGVADPAWQEFATVRAKVTAVSGAEQIEGAKPIGTTRYRITIRRLAVQSGMRLVWVTNSSLKMNVGEILDNGPRDGFVGFYAEAGVRI